MSITIECAQGSDEWKAARCGAITASMFAKCRKRLKTGPNRGDFTTAAKDYAFRLAIERISGAPLDEGYQTWAMERGQEMEPEARLEHEMQAGVMVRRAGFVLTDDRAFGCSADGFIDSDGGSEYKCFVSPERLRSILIDGDTSELDDQVQGCMWITGRKWWHIALYCPALRPIDKHLWWREVQRDENYIESMEADLMEFKRLVDDNEALLRLV
jgi:hypothetical protein